MKLKKQRRNRSRKQRGGFSQRRAEQKEIFQPTRMGNIRRSLWRSKCSTRFDWSRGPLEIHHSDQKNTEISQTTTVLKYYRHIHTDSRRDCERLWLWGVYEYTVSSFVSILYHCRAFASSERPCYSLSVWCQSDKKRDVTSFLWLDIRFLFLTGKDEGS
jgi:hypothetical protein